MGEKGRTEMGIVAAPGMCLELMEEEILSGAFQSGSGQLSGCGGLNWWNLRKRFREVVVLALGRLEDCLHITVEGWVLQKEE